MTRLEHTDCPGCAHYREEPRYGGTPTCAKATHPHGRGAQLAEIRAQRALAGPSRELGEDDDIEDCAPARVSEPA